MSCNLLSYQDCDDIRDLNPKQDVDKALRGADCVFHLASYGMLGKEMLRFMWAHIMLYLVERRLWMATRAYLTCLLMTMLIHTGIANQSHKTIASEAECSSFKRVNDSQDSSCPMVPVILLLCISLFFWNEENCSEKWSKDLSFFVGSIWQCWARKGGWFRTRKAFSRNYLVFIIGK
jgi:hypothetical protein